MRKRRRRPGLLLSLILGILGIPWNFLVGLVTGLGAPVAAVAAMVAGIRLLTGKVPFLGHVWVDEEGERHLSFKLVPPDQVEVLFAEQREQIGDELVRMKAEIQAIIEEARAQRAAEEESRQASVTG